MSCSDIFLGFIAILFPPIAVWIKAGLCSADSCINILLCVLGYIPGLIHAWYIISKYPEHDYEPVSDSERGGRVTYYYIEQRGTANANANSTPRRGGEQSYGTTAPAVPKTTRPQQGPASAPVSGAAGSSSRPEGDAMVAPPSYSEAVAGDHKVQI